MNTKHAKSPCCQGKVIKFGERRRQCCICRKTWRIRQKKTGRKRKRVQVDLAASFLKNQRLSCYALSNKLHKSEDMLNRIIKRSLNMLVLKTPYSKLPTKKPLVVIADAMIQQIESKIHTVYFILVKTPESREAIIAPPYFEEGKESCIGWKNAFSSLPKPVLRSITAIVSDGHLGLKSLVLRNGWLMQRCQFHLLASLQGRRSKSKFSRHREAGEAVFTLVKDIINNKNESDIQGSINRLKEIRKQTSSPGLSRLLRGFIKTHKQFRTFIDYPELNLPRTSNSAESMVGCVRSLLRRTKGFRSIRSLRIWIEGLIKCKKKIVCNGYHQPS
jgi:transposase-like protein